MRIHFVLNHGECPVSKLADVEVHVEEGLLSGLKLVGCSVWKSKKGEAPTVLVPSRSYATASGIRYFELIRRSQSTGLTDDTDDARKALKRFKEYVRSNYLKIAALPDEGEVSGKAVPR